MSELTLPSLQPRPQSWGPTAARQLRWKPDGELVVVLHWLGRASRNEDAVPFLRRWRQTRDYHLGHPTIPYVDVAYCAAVGSTDGVPEAMAGRGLDHKSGAEGKLSAAFRGRNRTSIVVFAGEYGRYRAGKWVREGTHEASEGEIDLLLRLLTELEAATGRNVKLRRHGKVRWREKRCPGTKLSELCGTNSKRTSMPGERWRWHALQRLGPTAEDSATPPPAGPGPAVSLHARVDSLERRVSRMEGTA